MLAYGFTSDRGLQVVRAFGFIRGTSKVQYIRVLPGAKAHQCCQSEFSAWQLLLRNSRASHAVGQKDDLAAAAPVPLPVSQKASPRSSSNCIILSDDDNRWAG